MDDQVAKVNYFYFICQIITLRQDLIRENKNQKVGEVPRHCIDPIATLAGLNAPHQFLVGVLQVVSPRNCPLVLTFFVTNSRQASLKLTF